NGRQHLSRAALERPVRDGRNPEGALFRLTGLGDIDPPNVRRAIPLAVDGLEHRLYPFFKALLRRLHRLAIHPGGGALWNLSQILLHSFPRHPMASRRNAPTWLTPSFRC